MDLVYGNYCWQAYDYNLVVAADLKHANWVLRFLLPSDARVIISRKLSFKLRLLLTHFLGFLLLTN